MKRHYKVSFPLFVAALLVIVSFQNCSSFDFEASTSQSSKGESDDDTTTSDTTTSDTETDETEEESGSEAEEPTSSATPQPDLPQDTEVQNAYANCNGLSTAAPDFSNLGTSDLLIQAETGSRTVDSANTVRVVNFNGDLDIQNTRSASLINVSGTASITAAEVDVVDFRSVDSSDRLLIDTNILKPIENIRAPLCVRAATFGSFVNLSSEQPLILIGRTVNGIKPRIDSLVNLRGVVIVRGVDIEKIVNFRGAKLVLEDSVVGLLQNVRTDIYLKNSVIGSELDVQGQKTNY